jgi:hypothetical protein
VPRTAEIEFEWNVRVRAKPTARARYAEALVSNPLKVTEVNKAEAKRRSADLCMKIPAGRYIEAKFKDFGTRRVHETWIVWPKPPRRKRTTAVDRMANAVVSVVPRHRRAELKARDEAAAQALPEGAPTTKAPRRPKWRRIRSI